MKAPEDKWVLGWRRKFVQAVQQEEGNFAELCRQFGFSRQTGYKYLHRFQRAGVAGLQAQSRVPHTHGRSRAAHWRERVRQQRLLHPRWGPKKIHAALARAYRPSVATVGRWLQQMGLIAGTRRRRRRGPLQPTQSLTSARRSNQVWTVDFKGSFRTTDGTRLPPLTVRDLYSRYVLCVRALPHHV